MDVSIDECMNMKVSDINKSSEVTSGKVRKSSGGADFVSFLKTQNNTQTTPVSGMANVSSLDAIFATQMVDGEEEKERRKKMIKHGKTLLDKLEDIRTALLNGYIAKDKLIEISRMVKEQKTTCEDERLLNIIAEIELRVEVELAKLTK